MRTLLGILSLLFVFYNSYAQFEYSINKAEVIKRLKVKAICIYNYNNNLDSFLTSESKFDMEGNVILQVNYSDRKRTHISKDTFLYNSSGLLLKRISFDNQRVRSTSFFEYDSIGRPLKQTITEDSLYATSATLYEKDGRHLTTISYLTCNNHVDTTIINNYFNKKGQLKTSVIFSIATGTNTITTFTYNHAGKVTKRKTESPESSSYSFTKYTGNAAITQSSSTYKGSTRATKDELRSSYYPNGLIFQRDFYTHNKPFAVERFYYSFY